MLLLNLQKRAKSILERKNALIENYTETNRETNRQRKSSTPINKYSALAIYSYKYHPHSNQYCYGCDANQCSQNLKVLGRVT